MIQELTWDTHVSGRKTGRLIEVTTDALLAELLSSARNEHYQYLTCRITEIRAVQLLEKHGFYMTDIGIVWERNAEVFSEPEIHAREGSPDDIPIIRKIAAGLFRDSRFYNDPFFSAEDADKIYMAWVENSLTGFADRVLLIEDKGFVTCKKSGDTGDIPLIGVVGSYQGRGIGTSLILNALRWFKNERVTNVTVRTQAMNSQAVNFYEQQGFRIKSLDVTMGRILDS